jgi:hypothetical protein
VIQPSLDSTPHHDDAVVPPSTTATIRPEQQQPEEEEEEAIPDSFHSWISSATTNHHRRRTSRKGVWWSIDEPEGDIDDDTATIRAVTKTSDTTCIPTTTSNDYYSTTTISPTTTTTTVMDVVRLQKRKLKERKSNTKSLRDDEQIYIDALTQPLLTERVWHQLSGTEWCTSDPKYHNDVDDEQPEQLLPRHVHLLDALSQMGAQVATMDAPTDWIDWREITAGGSGNKNNNNKNHPQLLHEQHQQQQKQAVVSSLVDGTIRVWTGKCCAQPPPPATSMSLNDPPAVDDDRYFGIQLPFIKTRAILPYTIPEVVDLLLDSDKVVVYNPWSLGRKDCWIDTTGTATTPMTTKIVQNRVQPPIPGARPVVSTTLLHARPMIPQNIPTTTTTKPSLLSKSATAAVSDTDGNQNSVSWIIVSRSIGHRHAYVDPSDTTSSAKSRSDILLGVNLLEPVLYTDGTTDPNSCILTAVTHVYSPAVPLVLAERLGVQSAIQFIQDIRNLKNKKTTTTVAALPTTTPTTGTTATTTNTH